MISARSNHRSEATCTAHPSCKSADSASDGKRCRIANLARQRGIDIWELTGKVAFITEAARGQGRSHAVQLAQAGADIIAVDICEDIPDGATTTDLAETVKQVENLGGRILAVKADVRDFEKLESVVNEGVAQFGKLDVVCANAGIAGITNRPQSVWESDAATWQTMIDINLTGVWNTTKAAVPHLIANQGGSIILTSSAAGLKAYANIGHYVATKHGMIGLMHTLAVELAPHSIRANAICPTQVDTPMTQNPAMRRLCRPDLENPTREDFAPASQTVNALSIPWVDSSDISSAIRFLASDDSRYVTCVALPVERRRTRQVGNASPVQE